MDDRKEFAEVVQCPRCGDWVEPGTNEGCSCDEWGGLNKPLQWRCEERLLP